jgi:predicted ATPase/DNA-binding winged helix-turn-helix (wHTH) protein
MNISPHEVTFREGQIRVDQHARVLFAGGHLAKLGGRAFDLLEALIERRDRVVPKQELMDVVWPGLIVEENNLQVHVMTLRKVLGADSIVTVSGRGYRFALAPDAVSAKRASQDRVATAASPDAGAHRLPSPTTSLIGREALSASICALMRRNDVRLVTLTGPGGSGKTRVGLHVTAELSHDFADGSYIVILAPVRDVAQVASAIAGVLSIQESGSRSAEDLLVSYLREREVLLTLDNYEHVAASAPLVTTLLAACPRLKVLITSRSVLKLSAEHDVVVPPLALPDMQATAKRAFESAAVRLFVERAQAAGQDVGASEHEMDVVAEVCRRLDGLPLAIELAAARLRVLSPQALLTRLDHRLQLLKSGPGNLPERQKTLRNAIAWSHDLLGAGEQALFRRLSVFAGGWSLDAAEAVAGWGDLPDTVLEILSALVDQSLVQRIEDVNGEPRFTMLETVREYALERLDSSGELSDVRQRHAEHFTELAEEAEPQLTSAQRKPWLAQLQAEYNNLRAALTWLIRERADAAGALRLAGALPWMWYFAGHFSEGRSWLKQALEVPGGDKQSPATAKALSGAARLCMYAGDPGEAVGFATRSVDLFRSYGDQRGLAFALFHQALASLLVHRPAQAMPMFQECMNCFAEQNDAWGVALAMTYIGVALTIEPTLEDESRSMLMQGQARFRALGDDWGLSTALHYLGTIAMRHGDYATARRLNEEMLQIVRDLGDNYRISRNLHQLAEIALAEKSYTQAIEHLKVSLALTREQGRVGDGAQQLGLLARLENLQSRPDRAVRLFAAASLFESTERTMPPDDPAPNKSALESARLALGERRFESEWALGAAMSFDQAVSWALAE